MKDAEAHLRKVCTRVRVNAGRTEGREMWGEARNEEVRTRKRREDEKE